jgi:hypothetical protein
MEERLFGKIDYKRARYFFHPEFAIGQALFVDSKAEQISGQSTATIQTAQTSMRIRHIRAGLPVDEEGGLPKIIETNSGKLITTTIFVKYNYDDSGGANKLRSIVIAGIPNGLLQAKYNPSCDQTIWRAGRNAPSRGEPFRVRLVFDLLKSLQNWRVQKILLPPHGFAWSD